MKRNEQDKKEGMMAEHVTVPLQKELKDALLAFAKQNDMSAATVTRRALAEYLNIKIVDMPTRSRQKRYGTPEERRDAQKLAQKSQRVMVKAAMLAARNGMQDMAVKLLSGEASLEDAERILAQAGVKVEAAASA